MKFIKSLSLKLLTLAFTVVSLSSQNHTIFLYGSMHGKYKKKDIQSLYINMAEEIENRGGTIEFWPKIKTMKGCFKKRNLKGFCNSREINNIYRILVTNVYYRQLKKQIIEHYRKTEKPINIIAIGNGIRVLKDLLQIFSEAEYNCIDKAIIIENTNLLRASRSNPGRSPFVREIVSAEFSDRGEIVFTKILNQDNSPRDEDQEEYISEEITESDYDEYSETEPDATDLSDKVVVIDAQEYSEQLEQQKIDRGCGCCSCCNWFTPGRIEALAKAGAIAASIIIPLVIPLV